eukprot:CAMPEP_0176345288 /NCGR_PEP_ID=MMETSP0126-20121128/5344_1 /TAXON_ID=141414 ORGANISM="Strombidinopsis acuminatum, Strain SPMC142" /NCGR_SAMPLE_ID=MMETSP0126 /ASSEMBLY_ACC=CAM_ASM_000229 /LENGTH=63 /DNA_ID=CAMNT_0017692187 /DNA_START=758 /DNA_END=949 /DNA_ORIENTATION=-
MAEVMETDEVPMSNPSSTTNDNSKNTKKDDKHLPGFSFESYPQFDEDPNNSPRLPDDYWNKFE